MAGAGGHFENLTFSTFTVPYNDVQYIIILGVSACEKSISDIIFMIRYQDFMLWSIIIQISNCRSNGKNSEFRVTYHCGAFHFVLWVPGWCEKFNSEILFKTAGQ